MAELKTKCMNVPIKVILHRTYWYRDAVEWCIDFAKENQDNVVRITNYGNPVVWLKNSEEHHFVPDVIFDRWCRGRTYWYEGVLYHSDYPVKGTDDGTTT